MAGLKDSLKQGAARAQNAAATKKADEIRTTATRQASRNDDYQQLKAAYAALPQDQRRQYAQAVQSRLSREAQSYSADYDSLARRYSERINTPNARRSREDDEQEQTLRDRATKYSQLMDIFGDDMDEEFKTDYRRMLGSTALGMAQMRQGEKSAQDFYQNLDSAMADTGSYIRDRFIDAEWQRQQRVKQTEDYIRQQFGGGAGSTMHYSSSGRLHSGSHGNLDDYSGPLNMAAGLTEFDPIQNVYDAADARKSSLYSSKYADILNREDYAEKSKAGESTRGSFFGYDDRYDFINGYNRETILAESRADNGTDIAKYAFMTPDEIGVYNYLYATEGKKSARQFLKSIDAELNEQWRSGAERNIAEKANANAGSKVAYSAATVLAQPARALSSALATGEDIFRTVTGQGIDENSKLRELSANTQAIRGGVTDNMSSSGQFFYNTAMSAGDSAVNMLVMRGAGELLGFSGDKLLKFMNTFGSATMSSEVAATSVAESKQKGYSDVGALSLGLVRGGIEYLTERMGGEWVIGKIKNNPLNFWNAMAHSMIPEGVEEVMSDAGNEGVNAIIDKIFGTEESYIGKAYRYFQESGSANPLLDTLKVVFQQELMSFAGGALATVGSGGVQFSANRQSIYDAADRLNTTDENIVSLMDETGIENPAAISYLADLHDANNLDTFRDAIASYQNAQEAIDEAMRLAGASTLERQRQIRNAGVGSVEAQANAAWDVLTGKVTAEEQRAKAEESLRGIGMSREQTRAAIEENRAADAERLTRADYVRAFTSAQKKLEDAGVKNDRLASAAAMQALQQKAERIDASGTVEPTKYQQRLVAENELAQRVVKELAAEGVEEERAATAADINARVTVDGKEAKIVGTQDGKVRVKQGDDTRIVDIDKIKGITPAYRKLVEAASRMENGSVMLQAYRPGQRIEAYVKAWNTAEGLYGAQTNATVETARKAGQYSLRALTDNQLELALRLGRQSVQKQTPAQREKLTGQVEFWNGGKLDGVDYDGVTEAEAREKLGDEELALLQNGLSKVVNITLVKSRTDSKGHFVGAQGIFYKNGHVYLDINAGMIDAKTGQRTVVLTAAHELTHFIRAYNEEGYKALRSFVTEELMKQGLSLERLVAQKRARSPVALSYDEAMEEVIADSCETMLTDTSKLKQFASQHPAEARTIADWLNKFLDKISSAFKGLKAAHTEAEAMQERIEDLRKLWFEALAQANQNADATIDKLSEGGQQIVESLGHDAEIQVDKNGDMDLAQSEDGKTIAFSMRTFEDTGKSKLVKALKENGHTQGEIDAVVDSIEATGEFLEKLAQQFSDSHGYNNLKNNLWAEISTNVKTGKQVISTLVNNGDYPVNMDLQLICKKRVAYMRMLTRLIDDGVFEKVDFKGSAIADLNAVLRDGGFETACLGCFVESRRLQLQAWAETIVEEWNSAVDKRNPQAGYFNFAKGGNAMSKMEIAGLITELENAGKKNDKGNLNLGKGAVAEKMGRLLDRVPSLAQHLTVADLLTPQGMSTLRSYDQNLFSLVKQRYGAASPKIVQDFNAYNSEIADLSFKFVKDMIGESVKGSGQYTRQAKKSLKQQTGESKAAYNRRVETEAMRKYLYDIGGARIQSFSDFMIENVFDYMQIIADLSAREFPLHGYSKEAIFLRLFGMTGGKFNGSLIAHVEEKMGKEYAGLLPAEEAKDGRGILVNVDGKQYAICFDDYARHVATGSFIQSIGMKDIIALQLDPRYSKNVGSITIGVSDKQILAMLDSPYFRMVIPYHASGMIPEFAKLVGVSSYNDYTDYQTTKVNKCFDLDGNPVDGFWKADGKRVEIDTHYNYNEAVQRLGDAKAAANEYLEWCKQRHPVYDGKKIVGYATFTAKFSDSPYGTDFTTHENYYKLLEDFNSYDSIDEASALQGAVTMTLPSETTRLTAEQMTAYRQALQDTGLFTTKEIEKYARKADMTFQELIAEEIGNRAEYESQQAKVWDETVDKAKKMLLEKYGRENAAENGAKLSVREDEQARAKKSKTLADRKELKFSRREIESLTDNDVLDMIDRRFDYSKKQYIPMRKDTPELLRFIAWYMDNRTIHDNPISMQVSKVSQALEVEGEYGEKNKPHDMTPEDLLEITHGMDTPHYIVYQEDLGRYAVIVDYYDGKKRQHGFAAFDIGEPRSETEIVDFEGGYYNTAVTMFNRNDLDAFLSKEENVIKYDKEKGLSAAASDNLVSWRNRQDSSRKTKVPQDGKNVNGKKSDRDINTFTTKADIDAEISRVQDQIRDIQNAQWNAVETAKKDPRVQDAQQKMWAAEDAEGYAGALKERMAYRRILKEVKEELAADAPQGDLQELADRVNELKALREQYLKVTPITATQYNKLAKHFGTTDDYGVAGFILQDGRMLDFSGKKQYGSAYAGGREVYHNEVGDVLNLPTDTSPRIDMVSNGNIRLVPEINGINLSQKPTAAQKTALRGFIDYNEGSVHVDIDNAAGRTVESFGYYKGTSASKVLADIDRYFATGEAPAPQSDLRAFHSDRDNLGYHAGDLGKAEHLNIQGRSRGTGHFGTGTYFVGVEEKVTKDSHYGKRPQHAVDFSDYNLFKVRNDRDGYRLHDALRIVDGGIEKEWIGPAIQNQFNVVNPTGYYDLARSKYGEDWASGDNLLNSILEYARENGIDVKSLEEYKAEEGKDIDDEDLKYYYEDYVKDTVKEKISSINAEYRELMDAVFDLHLLPGFTNAKIASALRAVAEYQDVTPRNARADSYATVFMKAMGYEGVDVRGTGLDNTAYGSVIYDVKPETVRYSLRDTEAVRRQQAKDRARLNNLRAEKNAKIESVRKEEVAKRRAAVAKEKAAKWEKVEETKQHYRDMMSRQRDTRNENAGQAKYRAQVTEKAAKLQKMLLTNSDKVHVPEVLKGPLAEFLSSIDFSSKSMLRTGTETKADAKFQSALAVLSDIVTKQERYINGEEAVDDDLGGYLDVSQESMDYLRDTASEIHKMMQTGQTFTVNSMTAEQLKGLSKLLSNLTAAIRNMNNFMANERYASIREAADQDIQYMERLGSASNIERGSVISAIGWENGTPYYIMKRFGEGAKSVFDSFTKGWEKMAINMKEIVDFTEKAYTDKEVQTWQKEMHDITLSDGQTIHMTTAQLMEFSQLLGRAQAVQHEEKGGIRIGDIKQKVGKRVDTKHYHLTTEDITAMLDELTPRQLEVAKALQQFMAKRGAAWGNEVSMRRYGYNFYDEGDAYYPIRTDSNDRGMQDTEAMQNSMFRLLNLSASKSLNPRASNALLIGDIFDTFADHMADMAKLNGMGLPILDAIKWFNYKERIDLGDGEYDTRTLQGAMEQAFGSQAQKYFRTLMKDINGMTEAGDRGTGLLATFMGNYKAAAVAANLRVALLQPTSYVRASALISPKYLLQAFTSRNAYQEALEHSGTATWKAFGYYDTNISRGMREQIEHNDSLKDKIVEKSMVLAELGDKLTWGRLWVACKMQTKAQNKDLTGQALIDKTADLFREVIYATQVMDSTLTRSELMRGKTLYSKAMTAFMAEPTLSYNILMDAVSDYRLDVREKGKAGAWQRNSPKLAKSFAVYAASAAFSAVVESIADAFRDDDPEEFLEKFLNALLGEKGDTGLRKLLTGNLLQDLTIIGKLPYVKSMYSTLQGYKSKDMSSAAFDAIIDTVKIWDEAIKLTNGTLEKPTKVTYYGNMTTWGKIYKSLQALSQLTGIGVSNLTRDALALWNTSVGTVRPEWRITTYQSKSERTYLETVRPAGVSWGQYQKAIEGMDADANGSVKQDEAGPWLAEEVKAGRLTQEQASAIWSAATNGKKTFEDWLEKNS